MRLLMAVAIVLLSTTSAMPQEHAGACHGSEIGWVPRELLHRPISLRSGIGLVDEPVTTSSKEARAFYNQGLAYLHSFVFVEAARSFNEALRHDPKLAIAHLGLARTYVHLDDREAAKRELEKARALQSEVSSREQRRIAIFTAQLTAVADVDNKEKHLAYKKAIDDALAADLDDPELWLWRGNAEEANALGRGQRGGAASIAFYERALQVRPGHFGAHHYLIHSYEFLARIDEALAHGAVYAAAADAVAHAHHMYGHDLRRVGRIKDAIAAFERADRLEREYFARENVAREVDWHHAHNLDLLAGSYRHMGKLRKAEELWRESFSIRPVKEGAAIAKMDLPAFLLSRGRNEDAAVAARTLTSSEYPSAQGIGYALLGEAVLAQGDLAAAERHLAAAQKIRDAFAAESPKDKKMLQVSIDALRGSILVRKGDREKGTALLERVQATYRGLRDPDGWAQALFRLELIARQAREAGDWKFAEFMAKQMFEHDPAYGGTHFALAAVAQHRGDQVTADREMDEAKRLWGEADDDLAELATVRKRTPSSITHTGSDVNH
ncbi:MAG TPA: tetratricopeptide repeat protein [Thermoanaerobaculia bacterium]|nr:tetratricopeptide repeat protein [Thermoanaerobaculia bacterium]